MVHVNVPDQNQKPAWPMVEPANFRESKAWALSDAFGRCEKVWIANTELVALEPKALPLQRRGENLQS